jgi:hypothetical protein
MVSVDPEGLSSVAWKKVNGEVGVLTSVFAGWIR